MGYHLIKNVERKNNNGMCKLMQSIIARFSWDFEHYFTPRENHPLIIWLCFRDIY